MSPSVRQVAHALLTRPPLSHKILQSEEIRFKCFVRLACVKHAASVHPEPGSNSLKKCLFQVLDNCLANSFFTVVCTPDDRSSEYKKKLFKRIFKVVSLFSCQCASAALSSDSLINLPRCQIRVKHNFLFFSSFAALSSDSLINLSRCQSYVNCLLLFHSIFCFFRSCCENLFCALDLPRNYYGIILRRPLLQRAFFA